MKTIGLLGGMTYYSTVLYYTQINARIHGARGGSNAASIILHSFDFGEMGALLAAGSWDAVATKFIGAAQHMKAAGAQGIAIGCNMGHAVAKELGAGVGLPVLHIADFTAQAVRERGWKKVALVATKSTMEGDFISGPLRAQARVEVLVPNQADRDAIDHILFNELALGGVVKRETKEKIKRIVNDLIDQGAEGIVLACTDLQFAINPEEVSVPVLDTLELHTTGLADWALDEGERGAH